MTTDLVASIPGGYGAMLERVGERLPALTAAAEPFNKSSSQAKAVSLDVTDVTPIASARHILAVITRTRQALEEANINLRRKALDARRKEQERETATGFDAEVLDIDLSEIAMQTANIEASVRGAIRRISFMAAQYDAILVRLGVDEISEADYEADEPRHHVMTAFAQALSAARSHGGMIDEGNHIYLFQLGINGSVAQAEVSGLLALEQQFLDHRTAPTHALVTDWLEAVGERFAPSVGEYIVRRGLLALDEGSLITSEAT